MKGKCWGGESILDTGCWMLDGVQLLKNFLMFQSLSRIKYQVSSIKHQISPNAIKYSFLSAALFCLYHYLYKLISKRMFPNRLAVL
jgi:hypothetical protein